MISLDERRLIAALCDEISPAPWSIAGGKYGTYINAGSDWIASVNMGPYEDSNATFIVTARDILPRVIADIDRLTGERLQQALSWVRSTVNCQSCERLRAELRKLERHE